MQVDTFEVGPNSSVRWPFLGRYVRVLKADAPVLVKTDTDVDSQILPGLGGNLSDQANGEPFEWVRFSSEVVQTITVVLSPFPVTDNRIVGNVNSLEQASESIQGLPAMSLDGAGTVAANVNRRRLDLHASPDNAGKIWIGATASGEGIALTPNAAYQLTVSGDVSVYADVSGDVLEVVEVL